MNITAKTVALFWENIDPTFDKSCWIWTGPVSSGAPMLKIDGKCVMATRIAFVLSGRHIPPDRTLQHQHGCPRLCVRPSHLSVGRPMKIIDEIAKLPICRERKRQLRKKERGICIQASCNKEHVTVTGFCKEHVIANREMNRRLHGAIRRNKAASYNL